MQKNQFFILIYGVCWTGFCGFLQIILGSSSIARRKILAEMGYDFTIMVLIESSEIFWFIGFEFFADCFFKWYLFVDFLLTDCWHWRKEYPKGESRRVGCGSCWGQGQVSCWIDFGWLIVDMFRANLWIGFWN